MNKAATFFFALLLIAVGLALSWITTETVPRLIGFVVAFVGVVWLRVRGLGIREGWRFDRRSVFELSGAGLLVLVAIAIVWLGDGRYFGYLEEYYAVVALCAIILIVGGGALVSYSLYRIAPKSDR